MDNIYVKNPIKVRTINPMTNIDIANYVFLSTAPKNIIDAVHKRDTKLLRDFYGRNWQKKVPITFTESSLEIKGGDEDDFGDIEQLLEEKIAPTHVETAASGLHYVTDVYLYIDDNLMEVKEKIYLALGIPAHRQHLFWINSAGIIETPYTLRTDVIYTTDINTLSNYTDTILGMPMDKKLYMNRELIRVEAHDNFILLGSIMGEHNQYTLYVVDLAMFLKPKQVQLLDVVRSDEYQLELLYYSFIIKYWPQHTLETFKQLIISEEDLPFKYPELAKDKTQLKSVYRHESDIINYDYKNREKLRESVTSSITAITTVVDSSDATVINIRNLFDLIECDEHIVELHAYITTDNGSNYMLRKRHIALKSTIIWPSGPLFKDDLNIAYMTSNGLQILFISIKSNGKYFIRSTWHEEDNLDFNHIRSKLSVIIEPIINTINTYGRSVFAEGKSLRPFIKQNITYQGLSACIFWKRVMIESAFKQVRHALDPYAKARLLVPRNVANDKFEFMWRKGMYEFDTSLIERILSVATGQALNNYYTYLSNSAVQQKWIQNYDGRIARMYHRTTDIKFEIIDVHQDEFNVFTNYIKMFIYRASQLSTLKDAPRDYKNVKKIRKLREQDPELYNTKKHGSDQLYSIKCQNPRQPMIYTADELKSMGKNPKLISYWNFTFKRPAYYSCPNPEYPYMSFLVDIHPKGYCLPCCSKKPQSAQGIKKQEIRDTCMRHHVYNQRVVAEMSRHIVGYGKDIDPGRLSHLNNALKKIFIPPTHISIEVDGELQQSEIVKTKTPANYYLYGVPQNTPGATHVGFVHACAHALGTDVVNLTKDLLKIVTVRNYERLLSGTIIEYWRTYKEFISACTDIFINGKLITDVAFNRWAELFSDLLSIMNVSVIVFTERADMYCEPHVLSSLRILSEHKYIFINKRDNKYYPIYLIAPDRYFSSNEILKSYYNASDAIVVSCSDAIKYTTAHTDSLTLDTIKEFCESNKYNIVKKLINNHGLCYAVIVEYSSGSIYIPIEYSIYITDGIPVDNKFTRDSTFTSSAVLKFITKWNKKYKPIELTQLCMYRNKPMSLSSGNMHFYISVIDSEVKLPVTACMYDYVEINNAILDRKEPTENKSSLVASAFYKNYLYQLYLIEFMNYIENEKNVQLRKKIMTIVDEYDVKNRNDMMKKITELLVDYPVDLSWFDAKSFRAAYALDKKSFVEDIEQHTFTFDKITINKLKSISDYDEIIKILKEISQEFTVRGKINIKEFPNIYEPCAHSSADYCASRKLIIDQPLDDLVSILASDLKNELKSKFLLDTIWYDTVVNYFDFIRRPRERIDVYKM